MLEEGVTRGARTKPQTRNSESFSSKGRPMSKKKDTPAPLPPNGEQGTASRYEFVIQNADILSNDVKTDGRFDETKATARVNANPRKSIPGVLVSRVN